jgi:RimJ/RimL family protein N-acetyltransferase
VDGREKGTMDKYIDAALSAQERGVEYPFTVFSREDHRVLGSTRYMDVRPLHRGVEIGGTWYTSRVWGTVVNPECKFLLLEHAFEDWNAVRVQLKTDNKNVHSQNAILQVRREAQKPPCATRRQHRGQHDVLDHRCRVAGWRQGVAAQEDRRVRYRGAAVISFLPRWLSGS